MFPKIDRPVLEISREDVLNLAWRLAKARREPVLYSIRGPRTGYRGNARKLPIAYIIIFNAAIKKHRDRPWFIATPPGSGPPVEVGASLDQLNLFCIRLIGRWCSGALLMEDDATQQLLRFP